MVAEKDYYKILQVDPSAEPEVITAAYRRLMQKYHPDNNKSPDATSRAQKINEAYSILSNPNKRREFDSIRFGQPTQQRYQSQTTDNTKAYNKAEQQNSDSDYYRRRQEAERKEKEESQRAYKAEEARKAEERRRAYKAEEILKEEGRQRAYKAEESRKAEVKERQNKVKVKWFIGAMSVSFAIIVTGLIIISKNKTLSKINVEPISIPTEISISTSTETSLTKPKKFFEGFIYFNEGKNNYIKSMDGNGVVRVYYSPDTDVNCKAISPDGQKIVCEDYNSGDIFFVDYKTGLQTTLIEGFIYGYQFGLPMILDNSDVWNFPDSYEWSPDSQEILFRFSIDDNISAIFKININEKMIIQVTYPSEQPPKEQDRNPHWSPDGKRIIFYRNSPFHLEGIFSITSDGSDLQFITPGGNAFYSPDGKKLALLTDGSDFTDCNHIGVMTIADNSFYCLDSNIATSHSIKTITSWTDVRWSPDSEYIAIERIGIYSLSKNEIILPKESLSSLYYWAK